MGYKTDHIVILGGGSAGWMSAATLIKAFPHKKITVIESPNVPTVGVGESTVGEFATWLDYLGIDRTMFMKDTDASIKLAIGFTDFLTQNSDTFYLPFGNPDLSETAFKLDDWAIRKTSDKNFNTSFTEYYFPQYQMFTNNRLSMDVSVDFGLYDPSTSAVYQIDATKFGKWLAENYAKPKGVVHISNTVVSINSTDEGIVSLLLEDGVVVKGDFFIDCSGFKSMLLGKHLKEPFISTKDILPNNKAWFGPIQYTDKEKELSLITNCTGLSNGWVWNTPLWSRIGSGYVYSDEFISDEEALQEFKSHLNSTKMDVYDPHRSEKMTFKQVHIRNGHYERSWVKNVCAIGLSAGFLEPLESTGLFFIHDFLLFLVSALERDVVTTFDAEIYNSAVSKVFTHIKTFIAMHFAMSKRDDSEYWRKLTSNTLPQNMYDHIGHLKYLGNTFGDSKPTAVYSGFEIFNLNHIDLHRNRHRNYVDFKNAVDSISSIRDSAIQSWKHNVAGLPTHYEWLRDNIYETE